MSTGNTACFLNINGTVHAILNWRTRQVKEDVIIGCRLNKQQKEVYERMVAEGRPEEEISDRLFPVAVLPPARTTVEVDVDLLSKTQLVHLIRERLKKPLPSLDKLNASDLRSVLGSIEP